MRSRSRWPAGGALLLGGAVIVVGCAKGGPGEAASAFGTDDVGFAAMDEGGGATEASADDSSVGSSDPGLNTPPGSDMSGDDASGASGNAAPAVCDPNTCQNGCCANGACAGGMDDTACGQAGGSCTDCTANNQVCSFGSCIAGNESSPAPTDTGSGSSPPGGMTPPDNPPAPSTSCGGSMCTNACFPLGLPCCTSAGACGCIALYFLPCQ